MGLGRPRTAVLLYCFRKSKTPGRLETGALAALYLRIYPKP